MTCVATDGKTMAADGRINRSGNIISDTFEKVWRAKDGSVVGACGDVPSMTLAREWIDAGAAFDVIPKLNKDFEAIRLHPDGRLEWFDQGCIFVPYEAPFAVGSGARYAISAMALGLNPVAAVKFSARFNALVGGKVLSVKPKRKRKK